MQHSQHSDGKRRRVSLSKHRDEIEQWVADGRSDEWIANALGTSSSSVQSFRSRADIRRDGRGRPPKSVTSDSNRAATGSNPSTDNEVSRSVFEGVLDQGEDGYGLWLDPAVAEDPLFREGFDGVSDVRVVVEAGRIILEPAAEQNTGSEQPTDEATASDSPADWQATTNGAGSQPEQATVPTSSSGEPGRVKFFDGNRGYGFIIRPEGGEIFFHRSEIQADTELEAGEYVTYEPGSSSRGPAAKKVRAVN